MGAVLIKGSFKCVSIERNDQELSRGEETAKEGKESCFKDTGSQGGKVGEKIKSTGGTCRFVPKERHLSFSETRGNRKGEFGCA